MRKSLRLLLLEDSLSDAELMLYELQRGGFDVDYIRVENEVEFLAALNEGFDLILADYNLPQFTGLRALDLVLEQGLDIPFILVSGKIGEDRAVETIQRGATDYLLKDRLARLGNAVANALERKRLSDEKKTINEELRAREHSYAELLKNLNGMVYRLRCEGEWTVEFVSDGCIHLTGYAPTALIGEDVTVLGKLMVSEDLDRINREVETSLTLHQSYSLEYRIRQKNGHTRWLWDRAKGIYNESGELIALEGLVIDIDERKKTEERISTQLQRLAALHTIDLAITSNKDLQQTLQIILEQTTSHLGVDAACILLLDTHSDSFIHASGYGFGKAAIEERRYQRAESVAQHIQATRRLMHIAEAGNASGPIPGNRLNGEKFATYAAVPLRGSAHVIGVLEVFHREPVPRDGEWWDFLDTLAGQTVVAVDNARLSVETQLLLQRTQAQARLTQGIIDSFPDGMVVLDATDRLLLANPTARLQMPNLEQIDIGQVVTTLGGHPLFDFRRLRGSTDSWQEFTWGEPSRIYEVGTRELNRSGTTEGWVVVVRDVTVDRQVKKHQQLNERMATVGQLAAGIAHDFNNINGAVVLFSELLSQKVDLPEQYRRYVNAIHEQSLHASDLIRQILDFSRDSSLEKVAVDFVALIEETVTLLERTLPENIDLSFRNLGVEQFVSGDSTRLRQMVMNLALNARDAMSDGGELRFQLSTLRVFDNQTPPMPDMASGEWLQFDVTDTGTGMSDEHLTHIFEPFYTTKPRGKGSGLGLAQVYGIVKQHGGSVAVDSQMGMGTQFHVYLPLFRPISSEGRLDEGHILPRGCGQTVLLVEDNDSMRLAIEDSIRALGFEPVCAVDGKDALEILASRRYAFSLVLSDLVMPRMGGVELSKRIRKEYPGLKVMIMSGYPLGESEDDLREAGTLGWIHKPFSVQELGQQIQRVLGTIYDLPSSSEPA